MTLIVLALLLGAFPALGTAGDGEVTGSMQKKFAPSPPLEFPKISDSYTPIIDGNDPKHSNLPPRKFPMAPLEPNATGPPILSGSEANITEMKHNNYEAKLNSTHENITLDTSPVKPEVLKKDNHSKSEQEDMLHSKYKGGEDVDELLKLRPPKKSSEKDEKKPSLPKENPKSEVEVSPSMDKNGPKMLQTNDTKAKPRESILESTSTVMAISSSVLANTKSNTHQEVLQPAKTVVSVLLSLAVVLSLGIIGLMVWKKIAMRRFGRDVLINEEDFDEVSDMHTFDRAQIQIT